MQTLFVKPLDADGGRLHQRGLGIALFNPGGQGAFDVFGGGISCFFKLFLEMFYFDGGCFEFILADARLLFASGAGFNQHGYMPCRIFRGHLADGRQNFILRHLLPIKNLRPHDCFSPQRSIFLLWP